MKTRKVHSKRVGALPAAATFLLATTALPLAAHHSVGAEFDVNSSISIDGTVAKVEWLNPHIWVYVNVANDDGTTAEYQCEGSSPNSLRRRGWTRDSLKPGERVVITGLRARLDPYTCYARAIELADGTRLFSGNASELEE